MLSHLVASVHPRVLFPGQTQRRSCVSRHPAQQPDFSTAAFMERMERGCEEHSNLMIAQFRGAAVRGIPVFRRPTAPPPTAQPPTPRAAHGGDVDFDGQHCGAVERIEVLLRGPGHLFTK